MLISSGAILSPFRCSLCPFEAHERFRLQNHMVKAHPGGKGAEQFYDDKPFKCSVCPSTFTQQGSMKRHELVHKDPTQKCDLCERIFHDKSEMKRHRLRHNNMGDIKQPECKVCQLTFSNGRDLLSHKSSVHNNEAPVF